MKGGANVSQRVKYNSVRELVYKNKTSNNKIVENGYFKDEKPFSTSLIKKVVKGFEAFTVGKTEF